MVKKRRRTKRISSADYDRTADSAPQNWVEPTVDEEADELSPADELEFYLSERPPHYGE